MKSPTLRAAGWVTVFWAIVVVLFYVYGLRLAAAAQEEPRVSAPYDVRFEDPWGMVGAEIVVKAVNVGGLRCAVMVARHGADRRESLWCGGR